MPKPTIPKEIFVFGFQSHRGAGVREFSRSARSAALGPLKWREAPRFHVLRAARALPKEAQQNMLGATKPFLSLGLSLGHTVHLFGLVV